MILYDKSGLFLGMGNQELYLLGYEDMEEFRNYHNDFADLFVNKPGFIFKFKNFSWIDYAQHSGTPNKRVLIRTKNGKEIETSLTISEIYLQKEMNGSALFFSVELSNTPFKHDLPIPQNKPQTFEPEAKEPSSILFPQEDALIEDAPISSTSISMNFDEPLISSTTFSELKEEDVTAPLFASMETTPITPKQESDIAFAPITSVPQAEETFDFKLKFDDSILETSNTKEVTETSTAPLEYDSIDQIKINDLNFVAPIESYPEDKAEDLLEDHNLHVEELRAPSTPTIVEEETFDLSQCAEELGLDISTLAQILEEYVSSLDATMPLLTQAINANNRNSAKDEITKLKSVALHLQILSLYHQFEHLETSLEFDTKEEILYTLKAVQATVNHFKENVL